MVGFIVDGYRKDRYYWEFIIFGRKIFLNAIKIYMENSSASIKSLVIMVLFLSYLILQLKFQPYESHNLNKLEEYSLASSGLSLYITVYIIAIINDSTSKFYHKILISCKWWFTNSCAIIIRYTDNIIQLFVFCFMDYLFLVWDFYSNNWYYTRFLFKFFRK